jgi:dUTP pyrophosphatase
MPAHKHTIQVKKVSPNAHLPSRATAQATGYDLYSATNIEIKPQSMEKVQTDLAITPSPGTYCQILSRSGLRTKYNVEAKAGTIDAYTGNVTIILKNNSMEPYQVKQGDKVAQMVIYQISQPLVEEVNQLVETEWGAKGFGHSDDNAVIWTVMDTNSTIQAADGIKPYDIWFSTDPFEKRLTVQIPIKGTHPTLGMILQQTHNKHRAQLIDVWKGTAASKLPKWRSTIKVSHTVRHQQ